MQRSLALSREERCEVMAPRLHCIALLLGALWLSSANGDVKAQGPVLGPDAAAPLKAWSATLGLPTTGITINASSVKVSLGDGCALLLGHSDAPPLRGS